MPHLNYQISWTKKRLYFRFKVQTSRGCLTYHDCYIIHLTAIDQPNIMGLGEASPLPQLSIDYGCGSGENFEDQLDKYCHLLSSQQLHSSAIDHFIPENLPSLRFAFETALLDLEQGGRQSLFTVKSPQIIPINGLIWMGSLAFMQKQIEEKLQQGYQCLKIKVGHLSFEKEYQLLSSLRNNYSKQQLILRLDANGAYPDNQVQRILDKWAKLDIHSIEQPIMPGKPTLMAKLCKSSPIAIALDEELIGLHCQSQKLDLLANINPAYIILKPTLLGGFQSIQQWIKIAQSLSIKWWLTSALESNIGLNALVQFISQYQPILAQGLGTGNLYKNNFSLDYSIQAGNLYLNDR